MTLRIELTGTNYWGTILNCDAIGGFIASSPNDRVSCVRASDTVIYITNIGGFEEDPTLDSSTNMRIKFRFFSTLGTTDRHSMSNNFMIKLYANHDGYSNNRLAIFAATSSLKQSCYWANQAYCCLLYTSPSPRDLSTSRMPSSA